MKIAVLTTDNREHYRRYDLTKPHFGTAPDALLQGFAGIGQLEVHVISCAQRPMASPEKLAANVWFHSLHVPKRGWLRTGYQGCIRAIRRELRELGPDIVHGQGTERDCAMSAAFSGWPAVITIHGNMAQLARMFGGSFGSYQWLAARLEDLVLPRVAGVLCNSIYTESLVRNRAVKTWLVPNALRLPFFDIPIPDRGDSRSPTLISIGVICERKRQLTILEMAERLWRSGHEIKILFVGTADPHDKYAAAFVARMGNSRKFARHCYVDSVLELVRSIDKSAALVHIPSEEAFGLVVAEALARNRKLFATNVGGIPDIAGKVEGAELFSLNDEPELENAVARWIEAGSPQCPGGQEAMRKHYHPSVVAQQHLAIYKEVLNTRS